ncbi:hypothetical protein DTL92_29345 [Escherichia coli]|nr:hypothetical protein DTL92_29345 [Escherichia coli]
MSSTGSDRYAANCILPRQRITTVSNSDIIRTGSDRYAANCILPRQRITTYTMKITILINAVPVRSAMTG